MKSSAVIGGSFAPTSQFIKFEIHKVFLHFLNFNLCQNLSPLILADSSSATNADNGKGKLHNVNIKP